MGKFDTWYKIGSTGDNVVVILDAANDEVIAERRFTDAELDMERRYTAFPNWVRDHLMEYGS